MLFLNDTQRQARVRVGESRGIAMYGQEFSLSLFNTKPSLLAHISETSTQESITAANYAWKSYTVCMSSKNLDTSSEFELKLSDRVSESSL